MDPDSIPSGKKGQKKITKIDQVTKFINKMKSGQNLTPGLISDLSRYNLGRFKDDVSRALMDALNEKLDIEVFLRLVVILQARYEEFVESFQAALDRLMKARLKGSGESRM